MSGVRWQGGGPEKLARQLGDLAAGAPAAGRPAVRREAAAILDRSLMLVPVDRGGLRASRFGPKLTRGGDTIEATIGYSAPYARRTHENPRAGRTGGMSPSGRRYRHWAKVGRWHYLSDAMKGHQTWHQTKGEINQWMRSRAR